MFILLRMTSLHAGIRSVLLQYSSSGMQEAVEIVTIVEGTS